MTKIYAGIGSRKITTDAYGMLAMAGQELSEYGWKLRSGGAKGADEAFARYTENKEIHLPWNSYNGHWVGRAGAIEPEITPEIEEIAAHYHPAWNSLGVPVRKLMCRNVTIILGRHLTEYADFVACWTPHGRLVGGTSHGMKIAYGYDIPVFNLALPEDIKKLVSHIKGEQVSP